MPTRRGWEVLLGSLGVILLGRILGLVQCYVVGMAGLILVGAGVAWVRLSRVRLDGARRLRPHRVPVGDRVEVECCLTNVSARTSFLLAARDPFRPEIRFLVGPLAPGREARTSYQLRTDRRGVFELGPFEVELGDPFGLAATTSSVGRPVRLTVFPRVEAIAAPPRSVAGAAPGGLVRPPFPGQSGDSFYVLREYAPGDDLRRVHWASTARRDQLMIRQDDHPAPERTTVLLDLRAGSAESFEAAVSAAASVLSAPGGALVRLVDTAGHDSRYGIGSAHAVALMDRLAAVQPTAELTAAPGAKAAEPHPPRQDRFTQPLALLRTAPGGGTVVVVTSTDIDATLARQLLGLTSRFSVLVLSIRRGREGALDHLGHIRVISVMPGQSLASAWALALPSAGPPHNPARLPGSATRGARA